MNSFLKKIHDAVLEEDSNAPQEAPVEPAQRKTGIPSGIPGITGIPGLTSTPVPAAPSMLSTITISADANLTTGFVAKLREKFTASAFAGVLMQFSSTLEALTEDTPEEGKRFRMAIKVTKLSPEQLGEAYNSLLAVLDTEYTKFKGSVEQQKVREVDARHMQAESINQQIESKNKEIEQLMTQRDGINTDIVAAKTKLSAATVSFEGAVTSLQAEVNDSLQKLRIYLPSAASAKK